MPELGPLVAVVLYAVLHHALKHFWRLGWNFADVRLQVAAAHHKQNLILAVDVRVGQLAREHLVEDDAESVDVRLEAVRILVLHADHLGRHPQYGAGWLVVLLAARPACLDGGQAEVADFDHHVVEEDVVALEVAMDDVLGVQVVHALRSLTGDFDDVLHVEAFLVYVQAPVETAAFAPLRHNGQVRLADDTHEEQNVGMPRLAQHRHLVFEGLQLRRCRVGHVERFDGDRAVPLRFVHGAEGARADAALDFDLVRADLPVLDGLLGRRLLVALADAAVGVLVGAAGARPRPHRVGGRRLGALAVWKTAAVWRRQASWLEGGKFVHGCGRCRWIEPI